MTRVKGHSMQDSAHILQEQVRQSASDKTPLVITGGISKSFYGGATSGERLDTTIHSGITSFEPTELTITARAGTPLTEIDAALSAHGQMLACEPPHFSERATLGGMVASGLSGPGRAYRASVQDTVLGCTILNGRGEILRFGGRVMKNVAGYDISRLMTGSLGCLGVILDVTLKVIPASSTEMTHRFTIDRSKSAAFINDLRKQGLPVTASAHDDKGLLVRFSAGEKEVTGLGEVLNSGYSFIPQEAFDSPHYWTDLRDHRLDFFGEETPLWRLSVAPDADISMLHMMSDSLITEWGGALHWLKTDIPGREMFEFMNKVNGNATLFRHANKSSGEPVFQPLSPVLLNWHQRLKAAFDPLGIFNPGKMYPEF